MVDADRRLEALDPESWRGQLLLAGCDPALRTLALRAGGARWMSTGTGNAVSLFVRRHIHLAGVHSLTERDRRRVRGAVMLHLATWPLGFAVRRGNPLGIRRADDLGRPEVRMVNRERAHPPGSSSTICSGTGLGPRRCAATTTRPRGIPLAQAVALGAADLASPICCRAGPWVDFRQLEESFNPSAPTTSTGPRPARHRTQRRFRRDVGRSPGTERRAPVRGEPNVRPPRAVAGAGHPSGPGGRDVLLLVLPLVTLVLSTSGTDFLEGV